MNVTRSYTRSRFTVCTAAVALACGAALLRASGGAINAQPGNSSFHRHRHRATPPTPPEDPADVTIGERLFLETRFAQFFAASGVGVNDALPSGDPVLDNVQTTTSPLPGPFAGLSMNCRSCHFGHELVDEPGGGMRTYGDFARRSPVPDRADGHITAPRNSPPLVNASLKRDVGLQLHFDGEFMAMADLVRSTLTGRNFGWRPREADDAMAHIARVIREDDGSGDLAQEFGGLSYEVVLTGKDRSIPPEFKLAKKFRVDVAHASDAQLLNAVADLIASYTEHLEFSTDEDGNFNLSPYDVFLDLNRLPRQPKKGESNEEYSQRLLKRVKHMEANDTLQFVTSNPNTSNGEFEFHPGETFRFGADELAGFKIFFEEPPQLPLSPAQITAGGIGNCTACHAAPTFTDFRLHNTGVTQIEYDGIHGTAKFAQLAIPGLAARLDNHDAYLPPTPSHPDATGRFKAVPSASDPGLTDLGVWNVFANPDFPKPQARLSEIACEQVIGSPSGAGSKIFGPCAPWALLPKTIALFKTPGLRDLSHGAPYMHNGRFTTLTDVLNLYVQSSSLARAGNLRNGAEQLEGLAMVPADVARLVAFLKALNEDYN